MPITVNYPMKNRLGSIFLPVLLMSGIACAQPGNVTYVYTDPQGTPLAEADVNGNITATFDYMPYGGLVLGSPPSGPGYTGHVNDRDTGLVYMQARYYDPVVGRFLSADPVAPSPSNLFNFNRYDYASNSPIVNIDTDGRQSRAAGKQLGRALRAAWISKGDSKKYDAIMAGYQERDRQDLNVALGLTEIGIVKDAVEITITTANGGDATAQGTGAVGGEIAGQIAKKAVARKIGEPAAEAIAAIAGQIVGDVIETAVQQSQEKKSADRPDVVPKEAPRSRSPPPVTDFND